MFLITEGNAYFFSKYLLFDGMGDAYFKGYAKENAGKWYVMNIFFSNIHYLMLWMMPILRTTLNIFAKCSRGYVYSRGFILESTVQIKLFC